ncbi:glycosyltransferase family 4 protein [Salegentibacter salegens]|uniref:Glycosyltransferase involved in cell wall bisynthesis n=1 Tax=Salegentibacter salegens TaxID=143223 RepID=A0A1M7NKX3_9FLAO|nr:glycosyltransferase family 4 protein [Salegentibacter salegens]PRX39837.1 glycosyltransferase involved in cell wall biosynthesis [Salegentibacter salegens]SHN03969.1 Glycosyltransferase involved in cell wall bisynthesis [Salegentibacter salegens]
MKILYVTNMYPTKETPFDGVFIKEQVQYCHDKYNVDYKIFLIKRSGNKYLNYVKSIFQIMKINSKGNFDLIHVHFGLSGMFLFFKPFIKVPVVLTLHGCDVQSFKKKDGLLQKIGKMAAANADRIIILNDKMANILKMHQAKSVKIPCGINFEIFDQERNNLDNKSFLIGFPSNRKREVKNYPLFKAITDALTNKGYNIEVIEFINFTRKEMASQLSKLDCLLMTSHSEGSPQIIKEAMLCEVPIVTTKVGDVEFLLNGVKNCFVIDSFKPEPFVEKIKEVFILPPAGRKTNGKEKIKNLELDQQSVCSNIYKVYKDLLSPRGDNKKFNYH